VLRNGALLLVPPLLITFGLWSSLPAAYGPDSFNRGIPSWLLVAENILRVAVFGIPLLLLFGNRGRVQAAGWAFYCAGMLIYLASYLAQMYLPGSAWGNSMIGFTAPAWTTLFWLVGIGLVCVKTWLSFSWRPGIYISVASAFVVVHSLHAYLAYTNQMPA
jgi:hypothetical protein